MRNISKTFGRYVEENLRIWLPWNNYRRGIRRLGEDYLTAAVALEALGYGCENNGLVFVVNNHIWVSQNLIDFLYGQQVLKDKYLPEMVEGKKIGAIAITEPDSGSDALVSMEAYARF